MSWCGGGEISPTPGVECRVLAIHGYTLAPGSCPPSPGLAPCAILIWMSSEFVRYSAVTPNRPDATCLTALRRTGSCNRSESSPPSPVFDFAPSRFIAMARVSCASALIEPYDIAPVLNRLTISLTGSTSSMPTGSRSLAKENSPRRVISRSDCSSTRCVYCLKTSYRPDRVECCSRNTVSGSNRCGSPSRRHWYSPPISRVRCAGRIPSAGYAFRCRRLTSSAITSSPTPPSRDDVPVKYRSTSSCDRPVASKICAPVYDATVDTPIFDITLRTPLQSDFTRFLTACSGSVPGRYVARRARSSTDSSARYGLTAPAPYPISRAT